MLQSNSNQKTQLPKIKQAAVAAWSSGHFISKELAKQRAPRAIAQYGSKHSQQHAYETDSKGHFSAASTFARRLKLFRDTSICRSCRYIVPILRPNGLSLYRCSI